MAQIFEVTAAAIVKDEGSYIEEWIAYHRLIGVEHFFIFNNNSTDDTRMRLAKYISLGLVTIVEWPMHPAQIQAYNYAVKVFGHLSKWMALIDLDEFIFMPSGRSLPEFLLEFKEYNQLLVPFMFFGSSGHVLRSKGLVTERFIHRAEHTDNVVKCIVRPETVLYADVHQCFTVGALSVNEKKQRVNEGYKLSDVSGEKIRINHYFIKSQEEWMIKIRKGQDDDKIKTMELFHAMDFGIEDVSMRNFADRIDESIRAIRSCNDNPFGFANLSNMSIMAFTRPWFTRAHGVIGKYRKDFLAKGPSTSIVGFDMTMDKATLFLSGVDSSDVGFLVERAVGAFDDAFGPISNKVAELERSVMAGGTTKCDMDMSASRGPGRYFTNFVIRAEADATLTFRLKGHSPGGQPVEASRILRIPSSLAIATVLMSEMSFDCSWIGLEVTSIADNLEIVYMVCYRIF